MVNLATVSATDWAALTPVATVSSVVINSPPVVSFSVVDGYKRPVVGLTTSQLRFSIAKLVPGAAGSQSKWVSYIVGDPATGAPSRPGTENVAANLVDNKDGTYKYTFARDITGPLQTKIAEWFGDAATKANGTSTYAKADVLGADGKLLDYAPTLQHRVAIQLSGSVNGGTLANPANAIYDFVPATGAQVAAADVQREVVSIDSCNTCHEKLALHGGGRVETRYCVVCHTDQRKNGVVSVVSTAGKFPALTETKTVNATTGITSYSYSPETRVADGEVVGNFTTMVHKIHNGSALVKENYNYANVAFNNKAYSMLGNGQKMCSTCHDSTKAKQADNWSTQPSRVACGSCHDGIKWSDGTGTTLAGDTTGHVGKGQSSDATCYLCHSSADIKVYHQTDNVTKHNPTVAAGLVNFKYDIKSAAVDASNTVTVKFKISSDGGVLPAVFTPLTSIVQTGFTGSPGFLLSWAGLPSGMLAADFKPVDYDNSGVTKGDAKSVTFAAAGLTASSAPDADGYFTATIANGFPVGAKLRAVSLNAYYTQAAGTNGISASTGRHAISVVKAVTGDDVRRTVVDSAKCSNCHEWFEGHGGSRVYEIQVCVTCHVPNKATSGRGISDTLFAAYPFTAADNKKLTEWGVNKSLTETALQLPVTSNNMKDMIHGIHAGRDRVTPFMDARDRTPSAITLLDFRRMDFPGKLNNCETCHKAGTYSSVPSAALSSNYESINAAYAVTRTTANAKASYATVNADDSVVSPYAAACVSCHDSQSAKTHASLNGGQVQVKRGALIANGEGCVTCHGPGKEFDAVVMHK
ncbi:OmcA/MtrC family decaheme c-type cytochrome [Rhodoferax sp.]|uniref:OmcA/MtrC family decaheme c-type cytochrome n=1 Tax=Rhodoferax sp. TaxID=50421 RepID=UPI0025F737F5|nr:OmcA/MtrC family decaheme c-type cytochrome [Rhodoferax sp.]